MIVLWHETAGRRRAGFAVSRQIRRAVDRNRARRRLREAYRAARDAAPSSAALVVIGKPAALREPLKALTDEMRAAFASISGRRA